jgi:hypothetical protein
MCVGNIKQHRARAKYALRLGLGFDDGGGGGQTMYIPNICVKHLHNLICIILKQKFINLHRTQLQSYLFIYFIFNLNHTICFGPSSGHPQV